jgi:patatin-like phospholipase
LRRTLEELVDFSLINQDHPRLTVGAAHLRTSMMRYFDSKEMELAPDHIMASGALPPAFPAVRIDGELYWDGGILSNTPTERIFDDQPRRNSVIFAVHLWNPTGEEPETIWEILNRAKDIQYSSRIASHILRQRETHRLRHVINQLLEYVPDKMKRDPLVKELAGYSCKTRMHVVRLLAPRLDNESHTRDIDFSPAGIRMRWEAGYADTMRALAEHPWIGEFGVLDGVVLTNRGQVPSPRPNSRRPTRSERGRSLRPTRERARKRTLRAHPGESRGKMPHMLWSFLSFNRSAERSTTVLSPRFFHQWETSGVSATTSPALCTIGAAQLLAYSLISPSMM